MDRKVVIIGAGGHGKVVADIVRASGDIVIGFLDDGKEAGTFLEHYRILGKTADYEQYRDAEFVIAIGNGALREKIACAMKNVRFYTAIHPRAAVSSLCTRIGEGTVIMPNAVVNACATVGAHCIINTAAVVEHDAYVGNYSHVAVGAKLSGSVTVGEHSWIGVGAAVSNDVVIGSGCMIGAGAVVVKDILESGTYVGVPAKKIK